MFNSSDYYECTKKCKHTPHGNLITSAITKRSIDETYLISYISKICRNFLENTDDKGRTALHLAASTNKYALTEWLLLNGKGIINFQQKDRECGHSALHRAIYYGYVNIAVLLKRHGVSFEALDNDFVNPLQLCCRQKIDEKSFGKETFVWGKNKNYTLGIGNLQSKETPDILDYFRKNNIFICLASINEYHSLFLAEDNILYCAGHGKGGRLGLGYGNESTVVVPQKVVIKFIQKNEKIVDISAARNHSLILTDRGIVYSAGSNNHFQLGVKTQQENCLFFKEVTHFEQLQCRTIYRVVAQDFHSVAVGKTCLFVWGLNVGQFGTIQESITAPKQLPIPFSEHQNLDIIEMSNAAICIYASNKEGSHKFLYIFHKRKLKTFKNPLMEQFLQMSVKGGELLYNSNEISKVIQNQLQIVILTVARNIYFWYDDLQQFVKCIVATTFNVNIDKMLWSKDRLLFLIEGHCYFGSIKHKMPFNKSFESLNEYKETNLKKELSKSVISKLYLKRIPNISTASQVQCDSDGENFVALLENSKRYINIPELKTAFYNFSDLIGDSIANIYDVTFVVDHVEYLAHKIIICTRSKYLRKLIETSAGQRLISINIPKLTTFMFEIILKYIYTNRGPNENDLTKLTSKLGDAENTSFIRILLEMDLLDLHEAFKRSLLGFYDVQVTTFKWFDHSRLSQFYDITIKLEENKEIRAHKAILVSRLEYFKMMFIHSWSENNEIQMKNVKLEYLEPIVKFAYNNNEKTFRNGNFSENYMFNMIMVCDQFFFEDVRMIFEIMLSERVCIRNCGEFLVLGKNYNCQIITRVCMEFICHNLGRALESSTLDFLDPILLNEISQFYRACFNIDSYRNITPDADAISDEDLIKFIEEFEIEEEHEEVVVRPKQKAKYAANKSEIERRTYEKQAMALITNFSIEKESLKEPKKLHVEASVEDTVCWQKVSLDKKDPKKKMLFAAIKSNEVIRLEERSNREEFVSLKSIVTSPEINEENSRNSFTLADYKFKQEKSKKEKNRISSEPQTDVKDNLDTKGIPQNAWNLSAINFGLPVARKFSDNFPSHSLGSDAIKSKKCQIPCSASASKKPHKKFFVQENFYNEQKFLHILKDEIKDKQQFEKTKAKSLMLTQIEEEAIEQLKGFYNIDKVFDETIEIGRKDYKNKGKFNYAVWQCK